MEKYEISLWENVWVEDQTLESGGYYDENKICVIGADDMNTPVRAIEPKLVDNINGTHTFSFKMYKRYVDNITGETILNPFDKYLTNERKIKVFWKGYWYDFIIKKIQENSSDKSLIYTCQDLFIYELSKNGYELNFDTDLKNNIGSAQKLIKATLDGSTWQFDEENSEEMLQTYEAPVIESISIGSFETTNQTYIASHEGAQSGSSFVVQANKKILVFYDSIIDIFSLQSGQSIERDIQLICDNSNNFITELNNNLVIDNYCLLAHMTIIHQGTYFNFKQGNTTCFQLQNPVTVSSNYRGERFINTDIQVYDEELKRYVIECEDLNDPTHKVYRTEITEDNNPLKVINLVSNPTNFKNTEGWEPSENNNNEIPLNVKTYPDDFPLNVESSEFNVESALKIKGKVYNNAFSSNVNKFRANSYEQRQGQLSGIQEGDKYTFRVRGFKNQTISKSEYVFPEIDRTPIEVVEDQEISKWEKLPVYVYEGTYIQYSDPVITYIGTDIVGKNLGIGGLGLEATNFQFGQIYSVVSYGEEPIKFGLDMNYDSEKNKLKITNREGSTYGILKEPIFLNPSAFPFYYNSNPEITPPKDIPIVQSFCGDYNFCFLDEDFLSIGLVLRKSITMGSGNVLTNVPISFVPYVVNLNKSPQQVFGPAKKNLLYNFLRELLRRKAQSPENDTLDWLNDRTFTVAEHDLFYKEADEARYHPNSSGLYVHHRTRVFIMDEKYEKHDNDHTTYGPDFIFINGFYVFCDKDGHGLQLLIDNIAERIMVDPPVSTGRAHTYELLNESLTKIKEKSSTLKGKITSQAYYQINNTDKILNENSFKTVDITGPSGNGFSQGKYVVYITTINNRIYDAEKHILNWNNYQRGDFVAHLYRCNTDNSNFDPSDAVNWTLLDKTNSDFPLLNNGQSWLINNSNWINEDVIDDSINLYSFHGYTGITSLTDTGIGPVSNSMVQAMAGAMGIPSISAVLNNLPPDIPQEAIEAAVAQAAEALQNIGLTIRDQLSIQQVYNLGCYIKSYDTEAENGGLLGEFDKLLLYTFEPLIAKIEIFKKSFFDSENGVIYDASSVEDAEVNKYTAERIYDSDFPDLNGNNGLANYLEQSDFSFDIRLNNEAVFSISQPSIKSNHWIEYTLTAIETISLSDIKNIKFSIETNPSNSAIWIDNIQFFKNQYIKVNNVDTLIYPSENFLWENTKILYLYYEKNNNGLVTLYKGSDLQTNYPAKTSNYYKIATININRSNRFNILQTIAESFNGWIYFDIKHDINGKILLDDTGMPKKYVGIQQKKGNKIDVTFEYGIDLKNIQRSIDSNQLTTKIYVLQNSNEFGQNGFSTISRSRQNLTKAPFILDLSYFVQAGLINEEQLNKDLYEWYYPQMNRLYTILDSKEKELIDNKEKILRLQAQLSIYENYVSAAENELASLISDKSYLTKGIDMHSNKTVQGLQSSIRETENKITKYEGYYSSLSTNVGNLQSSIDNLEDETENLRETLNQLHQKFNNIYWPFIFEGTWIDEKYIDDDQYYLDGLMVAHNSSRPQLTYNVNVIRIGSLSEFSSKQFHVGDICYIIDKEFFGYEEDGITPIKERIIVYEITSYFDSPEKDSITVRNYRSKFDDLFQKIVATTQNLKFAEGEYTRVAKAITPERVISYDLLQDTFSHNENIILNAANQNVTWDETGITITNDQNTADKTRIIAGGIFITNDGGKTWKNAVRGDGISADILTAGRINSGEIYIYDKEYPMFRWDSTGISAYSCAREEQNEGQEVPTYTVNFSKFVRFDKFGLYGYSNPNNDAYLDDFIPQSEEDIWTNEYTKFGLTWKGFFLKSVSKGGGYVKISTDGDMIKYANGIIDRKIISSGVQDRETFYLTQNGNAVFSGELKAARGSFVGESSNSLLTLDNEGLVLKIYNETNYEEKFRIKYVQTGEKTYPYLELIGNDETSIILQNNENVFIGPKNFIGLRGITIGRKTFNTTNISNGVFIDIYYRASSGSMNDNNTYIHRRTYNIAQALRSLEIAAQTDVAVYDEKLDEAEAEIIEPYV